MLSPQSQRDSRMSGSSEWRFATSLWSFSELPLPETPTPMEEQQPQRPSQVYTPQRQSFIEGNHRMSRSETQLCLQDRPTQQEVQRSASVDRQTSPAPRVRSLSCGLSSAPVITRLRRYSRGSDVVRECGGGTLYCLGERDCECCWFWCCFDSTFEERTSNFCTSNQPITTSWKSISN